VADTGLVLDRGDVHHPDAQHEAIEREVHKGGRTSSTQSFGHNNDHIKQLLCS